MLQAQDIEAVLSIAAEKAYRNAAKYDHKRSRLGTWFYIIAYHAAIDLVRGEVSRNTVSLAFEPALERPREDPCAVDDAVIEDLMACVEALGPLQRKIAKADLLAGGEADGPELSRTLGIPLQYVYKYRHKYRASLLKRMNHRGHTAHSLRSPRR